MVNFLSAVIVVELLAQFAKTNLKLGRMTFKCCWCRFLYDFLTHSSLSI